MKTCTCTEWKAYIEIVCAYALWYQYKNPSRDLEPFRYCPWCGDKLELDIGNNEVEVMDDVD